MRVIMNNTLNEIEKLVAKRGIKFFIILALLLPIIMSFMAVKIQANDMITLPALNVSLSMINVYLLLVLPLFVFMTASELFAGEWEKGTLFQVRPINRFEVFLSKNATIGILCMFQLLIVWISGTISMSVVEKGILWSEAGLTFGAIIISIFPLMAIIFFSTFSAQWFKHSSAALGIMILVYVVMHGLPVLYPQAMYLFPTSYLDWHVQWGGNMNVLWMSKSITYLFSFSTLFLTAGYYMFNTKEM